jgi:hypothetical protein
MLAKPSAAAFGCLPACAMSLSAVFLTQLLLPPLLLLFAAAALKWLCTTSLPCG